MSVWKHYTSLTTTPSTAATAVGLITTTTTSPLLMPVPTHVMRKTKYLCLESTPAARVDLNAVANRLAIRMLTRTPSLFVYTTILDVNGDYDAFVDNFATNTNTPKSPAMSAFVLHYLNEAEHAHHLSRTIAPNFNRYDYIIQVHGAFHMLQIGSAIGCDKHTITELMHTTINVSVASTRRNKPATLYDAIYLMMLESEQDSPNGNNNNDEVDFRRMFTVIPIIVPPPTQNNADATIDGVVNIILGMLLL